MKRGFTLLELIVVVLVIAILASVALPLYTKSIEKSRMSEAKNILGALRQAEAMYYLQNGKYTNILSDLDSSVPKTCQPTHYFRYGIMDPITAQMLATRCSGGAGKSPSAATHYYIFLSMDGQFEYEGAYPK
jgi:prepilin-type N-terminal cleavage/methylation domain-containing protein